MLQCGAQAANEPGEVLFCGNVVWPGPGNQRVPQVEASCRWRWYNRPCAGRLFGERRNENVPQKLWSGEGTFDKRGLSDTCQACRHAFCSLPPCTAKPKCCGACHAVMPSPVTGARETSCFQPFIVKRSKQSRLANANMRQHRRSNNGRRSTGSGVARRSRQEQQ